MDEYQDQRKAFKDTLQMCARILAVRFNVFVACVACLLCSVELQSYCLVSGLVYCGPHCVILLRPMLIACRPHQVLFPPSQDGLVATMRRCQVSIHFVHGNPAEPARRQRTSHIAEGAR